MENCECWICQAVTKKRLWGIAGKKRQENAKCSRVPGSHFSTLSKSFLQIKYSKKQLCFHLKHHVLCKFYLMSNQALGFISEFRSVFVAACSLSILTIEKNKSLTLQLLFGFLHLYCVTTLYGARLNKCACLLSLCGSVLKQTLPFGELQYPVSNTVDIH